ncbi:MAG: phosphatidylglycerophosphatase A [Deltaproteobacteria bacterium]
MAGYSPIAPGTAGSLLGVVLYVPFSGLSPFYYILFLLFGSLLSIKVAGEAERLFGKKDCQIIVIDEVVGVFFTMFFLPPTWTYLIAGFFIFRFFDITKPFPARWIDSNLKGGTGIVLDDIVAGIYSNLTLWLLTFWGILK